MNKKNFFSDYKSKLNILINDLDEDKLQEAAGVLLKAYKSGKTVYIIGNGGSASTASHMSCDLAKTVRGHKGDSKWLGFKTVCLSDNVGLITAWANDSGYEKVYSGQLENLGQNGDVLVAISSSGNSTNIVSCAQLAKELGLSVVGISGFGGGKLKEVADVAITSNLNEYGPVEDIQLIVNHMLTNYFCELFSGKLES